MGDLSAIAELNLTTAQLALSRLQVEPIATALRHACKISAQALATPRVSVWMFEAAADRLRCVALYTRDEEPLPAPLTMSALRTYVGAVREQRFVATADAQSDPYTIEMLHYLRSHDIRSMLDAAIYRHGEVVGVVCHERTGPVRAFNESERNFATTVADVVAYLLEADRRLDLERQLHALEVQLKDAQRIDTVSRFAAGIAHDLGNLLAVVSTGLEVLERQGHADAAVLKILREATSHGTTLSRRLTRLTRGGSSEADRQVLLGAHLKKTWEELLAAVAKAPWSIALEVDPAAQLFADAVQLEQVLLNLVFNARDAMPQGGEVVVRLLPHDERFARLEVTDSGVGIPSQHLDEVFQPYFTTKGESGTGMGLSTVQFLVHEHGGRVGITSEVGKGTTVTVYWPTHDGSACSAGVAGAAENSPAPAAATDS